MSNNQRIQALRQKLDENSLSAILITNETNVGYLTGFTGHDSYFLLTDSKAIILSDPRYEEHLQNECPQFEIVMRPPGTSLTETILETIRNIGATNLGVEAASITLELYETLTKDLSKVKLESTSGLVEELREIKDETEVQTIRKAIALSERAFTLLKHSLQPKQTEKELAASLEYTIRKLGGKGCSFSSIIGVGQQAALPHAIPTDKEVGSSDFILVDWGVCYNQYISDMTRMIVHGKVTDQFKEIYQIVLTAQEKAIEAIKPGAPMSAIDDAARDFIKEAGYGDQFNHGLGHGIGREVHEMPRISASSDAILKPGMVVTVEPGIYLPEWGGVRIEDDILVTDDGHENLSSLPKDLESCLIEIL
ncbi:MAG: Xaa-Pro peptidase family protein [Pirellulaceae bacterium]|nr:Xaa-Pro peptidase family protein [Pirellulaceae bacterium]